MPPCLDDFPLNHRPLPSSDSLNNARPRRSAGIAGVALLLSSLSIAAAPISIPDAGQAVRDAQSQRLDLPPPVELDPENPRRKTQAPPTPLPRGREYGSTSSR